MRNLHVLLEAVLCVMLVGCGHGDGRQAVSGQITLDGQPLVSAAINFRPSGHQANSSGATVREGKFQIPAEKGLLPGAYDVSVQAYRATGRMIHDPQRGEVSELAPVRFNADVPREVVVRDTVPNVFQFDLRTGD